jgi:hypothetical protein
MMSVFQQNSSNSRTENVFKFFVLNELFNDLVTFGFTRLHNFYVTDLTKKFTIRKGLKGQWV